MRIEQHYLNVPLTRRQILFGGGLLGISTMVAAALSTGRSETTPNPEETGPLPQRVPEPVEVQEVVIFGTPSAEEIKIIGQ